MKNPLLLLPLLLTACAAAPMNNNMDHTKLWQSGRVESIAGHNFTPNALAQTEFGLTNEKDENGTRGYAYMGCNRIGFQAAFEGRNHVRFRNIFTTLMLCHDDQLEETFLRLMNEVNSYAIKNNRLILQKDGKTIMIISPRVANSEQP